ncbi:hypothetical protein Vretimale_13434 [Volvox reticuliferus]|uniref:Kinesin motor domain-containing protein n=1 Tax=Volvox reticuliferus TaxID=1737510 RepID=A0A8J4GL91_9CHLO|nr:hypothetical protein Vretifemale_263 [Volvox reticuliferus]GIM09587.1 hypothetical protein Vretimale_13434 [Volvox reticuliferus]
MSQQGNPSSVGILSRIPSLSTVRSCTNSRLPSPPVSPGISSPCTPQPGLNLTGNSSGQWAAGGFNPAQDKLVSSSRGRFFPSVPALASPNGASAGGHPPAGISRSNSMRASAPSFARIPLSPHGASGGSMPLGTQEVAPSPSSHACGLDALDSPRGLASSRSSIQVAVRVRPLCEKEKQRGDKVAWEADREGNVGMVDSATGAFVPKHRFDTVFGPESDNSAVAAKVALPLVAPALRGVNGTIFAYGVTSSGKTHTMMGTDVDPGVVPRVLRELFLQIASTKISALPVLRSYTVRMSIMEIYNEVLNDLLEPARTNLKVREDSRSGLVLVEGLLEQVVTTADQALELIARGDHNRKVSATAFNEDSSRSHTITRVIVESAAATPSGSSDAPASYNDRAVGRRTTACLSLIDLAGSESARAVVSKGQRMEGSFINRSLLTLGTVIHKLASGATGHVPFRDSKLTRLLQPSLSGPGARVAVVCNITPAAAQTDETANTLKFAARAKLIQVTARTNEILDERSMLRHYQKEVADLKRQLAEAKRLLAAAGITGVDCIAAPNLITPVPAGGHGGGLNATGAVLQALGVAEEAAAAALQGERDARRTVEIECTMMKIKLTRLQAFLEENGVDVDNLLLASTTAELGEGGPNASLRPFTLSGEVSTSLPGGTPSPPGGDIVSISPLFRRPLSLTDPPFGSGPLPHASSTSRLDSSLCGTRQNGNSCGAEVLGKSRGAYLSCSLGDAGLTDAAVEGGRWPVWDSDPSAQRSGSQMPGSSPSSPSAFGGRGPPANEASADLRAQVAAALEVATGGSCDRHGSVSGNISGSDLELDEDLNEGIMAQIRDMISEAQLSCPAPQSVASQPVTTRAEDGSVVEAPGGGRGAPSTAGRLMPSETAVAANTGPVRASSGLGLGAGGPASVSSQHRRSATLSTTSSSYGAGQELDMELELQVLNADREVLHDQLVASEAANEQLTGQVVDLRRQLATYEQLTRHASSELAEIRRLKDAFQARLQRENDALRSQLMQLGVTPATLTDPQSQTRIPKASGVQPMEPNRQPVSEAPRLTTQSLPQLQPTTQTQNYGPPNMDAFGSPAAVAPSLLSRPAMLNIVGVNYSGMRAPDALRGTPTPADSGVAVPIRH